MPYLLLFGQFVALLLTAHLLAKNLSSGLYQLTHSQRLSVWLMAFIFLPGTIIHELSHWLTAKLLLVKTKGITLWPRIEGQQVVMGHVLVVPAGPLRMFLIGIAPLLVGLGGLIAILWLSHQQQWWDNGWLWQLGLGYIIFQLANCLTPSSADLKQTVRLLVIIAVAGLFLYLLGFRPTIINAEQYLTSYQPTITLLSNLLWLPIIINLLLITILTVLNRR